MKTLNKLWKICLNFFLKNSPDTRNNRIIKAVHLEVGKIYRDISATNDYTLDNQSTCFLRFEGYDGRSYLFTWVAGSNFYLSEDRILNGCLIENAIPFSDEVKGFYLPTDSDVKNYNLI